jgi:hypothetical protein
MACTLAARMVGTGFDADCYQRYEPEQTLLYRLVEQYYPEFNAHLASRD